MYRSYVSWNYCKQTIQMLKSSYCKLYIWFNNILQQNKPSRYDSYLDWGFLLFSMFGREVLDWYFTLLGLYPLKDLLKELSEVMEYI